MSLMAFIGFILAQIGLVIETKKRHPLIELKRVS